MLETKARETMLGSQQGCTSGSLVRNTEILGHKQRMGHGAKDKNPLLFAWEPITETVCIKIKDLDHPLKCCTEIHLTVCMDVATPKKGLKFFYVRVWTGATEDTPSAPRSSCRWNHIEIGRLWEVIAANKCHIRRQMPGFWEGDTPSTFCIHRNSMPATGAQRTQREAHRAPHKRSSQVQDFVMDPPFEMLDSVMCTCSS